MKRLLFLAIPILLLASCEPDYQNKADGKPFPAQQDRQGLLDASTLDSVKKGWVDTVAIHTEFGAQGPVTVYSLKDVIVTVKKTGYQNWEDFWATTWRVICWFIGLVLTVGSLVKFITTTSKSTGSPNSTSPMAWLLITVLGLILIATTTYPWSNEMDVPKAVYDTNQAAAGDQHSLDWAHPQTY